MKEDKHTHFYLIMDYHAEYEAALADLLGVENPGLAEGGIITTTEPGAVSRSLQVGEADTFTRKINGSFRNLGVAQ